MRLGMLLPGFGRRDDYGKNRTQPRKDSQERRNSSPQNPMFGDTIRRHRQPSSAIVARRGRWESGRHFLSPLVNQSDPLVLGRMLAQNQDRIECRNRSVNAIAIVILLLPCEATQKKTAFAYRGPPLGSRLNHTVFGRDGRLFRRAAIPADGKNPVREVSYGKANPVR
jgi:hypothetical protein